MGIAVLIAEGNELEEQGRTAEAMARYDAAAQADPRCARAHLNRGNVLLAAGAIDEAREAYQLAIACEPDYAGAYFNLGNLNCGIGQYEPALLNYRAAVDIKPDFADALVAMGNVLDNLGRTGEAIASYERALSVGPANPGAQFNLGLLATTAGNHSQAVLNLRSVTEIWPDYAPAHHALGQALTCLGSLGAAEDSLRRACALDPKSEAIVCDLAMVLLACSKSPDAVDLIVNNLKDTATWPIKQAFANTVARTRFVTDDPRIRAALATAISEPWSNPSQLCGPALSLLTLEPRVARIIRTAKELGPGQGAGAALLAADGFSSVAADPLLHAVLTAAPVSSIEFECFLTAARRALLEIAVHEPPQEVSDIALLRFYSALSRQCFINEYIFDCDDSERSAAAACRNRLLDLLDAGAAVPSFLLLAVAAYFPLYTLPAPSRLLVINQPGPAVDVLCQQVREPLEEQALRGSIRPLTSISLGVSEEVRDQYEHNPYPRWMKLPSHDPTTRFNEEMLRTFPLARFEPMTDDSQPEMLIAGCGTGSQPIHAARRFRGVRILAVDLSMSSMAYAIRATREAGITSIEYAQADILKLGEVKRTFDVIASVGVLHHLADPFKGWRILLSLLRPGGFMQLGFYSQLARRHVAKTRDFIAAQAYAPTPDDIRRLRRDLTRDGGIELQWLSNTVDFYTVSGCRDLLFHVQESCLSLEQIDLFLSETGLRFIGFELDPRALHQYRNRFTDDPAGTSLRNWAQFEADNPDTFTAMYQFWVQKPLSP
jgi:tetratricopeptide (TPR) repeat protein/2-polyprenyl-3-methyl-5-hydroxy-6-metoxy-1,4-benzoquinol methylase